MSETVAPSEAESSAVEAAPTATARVVTGTAQPTPLQTTGEATSGDNTAVLIGGTGALVLLGAGFMAFRRRKTYDRELEAREVVSEPVAAPIRSPMVMPADQPAFASPARVDAPIARPRMSMTSERPDDLEHMVAAAPSRENPFLTRKNRLRRASFLIRQGTLGEPVPIAAERSVATSAAPARPQQPPARQTVYSFGGAGVRPTRTPRPT